MSNSLSFALASSETGRRLTITGPTALMHEATAECSAQFQVGKVLRNKNRLYSNALSDDGSRLTLALNTRQLGRLHNQDQRDDFLVDTNGFIHEVLRLARRRRVQPEPRLNLLDYAAGGMGEFSFVADVMKPTANHDVVKHLVIGAMLDMVRELHYPRRGDREADAHSAVGYRTRFDGTALIMPLSLESQVHSNAEGWDWSGNSFTMEGHNVQDGAEPLIYLAGAIAIAKADLLLSTGAPTLVQQR